MLKVKIRNAYIATPKRHTPTKAAKLTSPSLFSFFGFKQKPLNCVTKYMGFAHLKAFCLSVKISK